MSLKQIVLDKLSKMNVSPKRSLGQNFLVGAHVIDKIINTVKNQGEAKLIEIGPGLGALTEHLLKIDPGLTVIELDRTFSQYWRDQNINVIEKDAVKVDWSKWKGQQRIGLVSNLPYQIGGHVVVDRSIGPINLEFMILMFQKEVAQRITSEHKNSNYGFLTVIAQTFWKTSNLLEAGASDFYPPPNVASRVVTFQRKVSRVSDPKKYVQFVKSGFSQRRKLLVKNLTSFGLKADSVKATFAQLEINDKVRAEELTPDQFVDLYLKLVEST